MAEERDEKVLTGDLEVDDESASEVAGGREAAGETHESVAEFAKPALTKGHWTHHWKRHA